MRHVTRCSAFAFVVVLLSACSDTTVQPKAAHLEAAIQDGNHAGNPDFFFLPPLVSNPVGSPNFDPGRFNPKLAPTVEVCQLAASPLVVPTTGCTGGPLVFGPATMSLDATNQQYQLNWDTKASPLDAALFYRIIVRGSARGTALGFIDVDPVLGGIKNAKTGDVFVFQDGRTLPVKVRIEQGAFGSTNPNDFVEQVVPNIIPGGTLDVTTNTGFAGARFQSGWLNPALGIDQVVVIIDRRGSTCLSSGLEEMEGCYRFRTDPDLHLIEGGLPFIKNVIAGVCFQIPADIGAAEGPPFELARREEVEGQPVGPLTRLQEVPAPFIKCDGFGPTPTTFSAALRSGRLGDIAKAGWNAVTHTIGRVIAPSSLHAVDLGAGGSTDGFSLFGYARFASMTVSVDHATAAAGSTVQASAQIQDNHHGVQSAVIGQSVTFTVMSGGGTVSTGTCPEGNTCASTTAGPDGIAPVTWRLGPGGNTLQVTTTQVTNGQQTLIATGLVGSLAFLQQPTNTPSGQFITPALQIQALDATGKPMTDIVRVTVGNDPGNPSSCQVLQTSQDAINGVATFANVLVNGTCGGARVAVTAGGGGVSFPVIFSNPFDITVPQASLSVTLSTTDVPLEGGLVSYVANLTSGARTGLAGVVLQAYIDQGQASRAAGGTLLSSCGSTLGDLPPGPCTQNWGLGASNSNAGTGTLVPGPATARISIIWSGVTVVTALVPITITTPIQ